MPMPARVLVAGAGDVGLALARALVDDGVPTATLNRSGRSVPGAEAVVADLGDPATLGAVGPADVVVCTTSPPGRDQAAYRLAYVDGPADLLAAVPSPPDRVILTSTTGVYGVDDGSWVDETTPPSPTRATAAVVVEGERRLAERVPTVVVRAAGIYGPGRTRLIDRVRSGEEPVARDGTPRWTNRVHRDDLVTALRIAISHPAPPPVVLAVDDEPAPRDDVIRWLAARLGAGDPPVVDVGRPTGKRCRNTALRALGWTPRFPSYREGYAALLR